MAITPLVEPMASKKSGRDLGCRPGTPASLRLCSTRPGRLRVTKDVHCAEREMTGRVVPKSHLRLPIWRVKISVDRMQT
jgi:hypothetical protein